MPNLWSRLRSGSSPAATRSSGVVAFPNGTFGVSSKYAAYVQGTETIPNDFGAYVDAVKACPPAFTAQNVRAKVLSEARFVWRNNRSSKTPGRIWSSTALGLLEKPWPNATTGNLVSRMEWHAGLGGNSYVYRNRTKNRLRVLRPDWITLILGSEREPDDPMGAIDAELLGYAYVNGGLYSGNKPVTLLPDDVAHWAPIPDPDNPWVGMSWLSPAIPEMQSDGAVTEHKLAYFRNGTTAHVVIKGIKAKDKPEFDAIVDGLESEHAGVTNSFRTYYLKEGADASVLGSNLADLDLKNVQGASETRIASLSQVPAPILNIAEGLQGSSLNAGNLGQTRRNFGDTWCRPSWRDLCAALGSIADEPSDSELWFDASDVAFLHDDETDAADIRQKDMITIRTGVDAGFDPDAAVRYAETGEHAQLLGTHSGLFSVQLQPAGADAGAAPVRVQVSGADLARIGELFPGHRVLAVEPTSTTAA